MVRGASTTRAWCVPADGAAHDGAQVRSAPGLPILEVVAVDLPWDRDPVLAVCTPDDAVRDQVAAGVAAHRAVVTAGLHGLRADVHTGALDDAAERAAWGRRLDPRAGRAQALIHLHP